MMLKNKKALNIRLSDQPLLSFLFILFVSIGCAAPAKKLPSPPKPYVYEEPESQKPADGSLWIDGVGLFEDRKARRLNDILTIEIFERTSGSDTADTSTKKETTYKAGIEQLFGSSGSKFFGDLIDNSPFKPVAIDTNYKKNFEGKGRTTQKGELIGKITAKIVAVQPNGNLVIDSRKEITINNEKQIIVLQGIVRTDDISSDNTIPSYKIADAKLYYVGHGIVTEQQSSGILGRIIDQLWPF
jgi:flagellar L-ring protein precursor FlgH